MQRTAYAGNYDFGFKIIIYNLRPAKSRKNTDKNKISYKNQHTFLKIKLFNVLCRKFFNSAKLAPESLQNIVYVPCPARNKTRLLRKAASRSLSQQIRLYYGSIIGNEFENGLFCLLLGLTCGSKALTLVFTGTQHAAPGGSPAMIAPGCTEPAVWTHSLMQREYTGLAIMLPPSAVLPSRHIHGPDPPPLPDRRKTKWRS